MAAAFMLVLRMIVLVDPMLNIWRRITNVERELAQLETAAERRAIWCEASQIVLLRNRSKWLGAIAAAFCIAAWALLAPLLPGWITPRMAAPVFFASILLIPLMVQVLARRREIQIAVRRMLRERGLRVCMRCGYDLRGCTQPRCPECGRTTGELRPLD